MSQDLPLLVDRIKLGPHWPSRELHTSGSKSNFPFRGYLTTYFERFRLSADLRTVGLWVSGNVEMADCHGDIHDAVRPWLQEKDLGCRDGVIPPVRVAEAVRIGMPHKDRGVLDGSTSI